MSEDQKPVKTEAKSSTEILSELFSSFDVEPPLIIKKEKDSNSSKKNKKHKKKDKHKEKKHKKDKKRKRSHSTEDVKREVKREKLTPAKDDLHSDDDLTPEIKRDLSEDDIKTTIIKTEVKSEKELIIEENNTNRQISKIKIKNLKFSSIFEATIREIQKKQEKDSVTIEEGEIQSTDDEGEKSKAKKKHKHSKERKDHSHRAKKEEKKVSSKYEEKSDVDYKKDKYKSDLYCDSDEYSRDKDHHRISQKDSKRYRRSSRSRSRDREGYRHRHSENPFYKDSEVNKKTKERSPYTRNEDDERRVTKARYRSYSSRDEDYNRRRRDDDAFDKTKLLEIARKNAILMMKCGSLPAALTLGPQAQEKVLAAIRAGGKTIKELTEFCKALSKKEESGELSGGSANDLESDCEQKAFHHPFQIKDRPAGIIMNIKNSIPLPIKSAQERNTELRLQFPVSSGSHHRKTESQWVPVQKKENSTSESSAPLAIEAPPDIKDSASGKEATSEPISENPTVDPNVDISQIVSQRLSAMRKLQENPYDVEALSTMYRSQKGMQTWAESKQVPGQFTGSTGANILSQAELSSGYQAWAKKDQLQNAAPVSGGMGMQLLKKMGWNPGEGLGKDKTGALQPLLLEVKLDKKGLVANDEQKQRPTPGKPKVQKLNTKTLEAKHPVSLLGEFTAKKKLGAPEYTLCLESGPDHKKLFLFQVNVNGLVCKPEVASPNKKQAKADAAKLCLQQLGILPIFSS